MKIIGAILVCMSGGAFGLCLVMELKNTLAFYQQLGECLQLIRGDIRFGCGTLPEAFCSLHQRTNVPLASFFCRVGDTWKQQPEVSLGVVWELEAEKEFKERFLSKDEQKWFSAIGNRFGHLDKEMQINTIEMILEELEQKEKHVYSNLKEKGKLYPCVGTMSGILAALLLI